MSISTTSSQAVSVVAPQVFVVSPEESVLSHHARAVSFAVQLHSFHPRGSGTSVVCKAPSLIWIS